MSKPEREKLPPNYGRFIDALRNVGYGFEEAVADIIDNSIDAKAANVLLRFVIRSEGGVDLLIADDGTGMSPARLKEAMRFGTDPPEHAEKRLGMFGLGLKLASIAHARSVFVVSLKNGTTSGRAWTDEGLKEGFACDILPQGKMAEIAALSGSFPGKNHGTWVYWESLFRLEDKFDSPEKLCEKQLKLLQDYLGLHMHRLLGKTAIVIDILDESTGETGPERNVDALDPFGYGESGVEGYPLVMKAPGSWADGMDITAHIWPPNSNDKEYKLPGGANKRQGLYFYRNDRLLSAGSWHGMRDEDPHNSLARIAVDLHVDVERQAGVNVRKARVKLTPDMRTAIELARASDGTSFTQYVTKAGKTYRTAEKKNPASFPLVPDGGYPASLTRMLQKLLDHGRTGKARTFDFEWDDFDGESSLFFQIDRKQRLIRMNSAFRELFRAGERLSNNDGILVKTLLFIILRELLDAEKLSAKRQKYLDQLNEMLAAAARTELKRGGH